MPQRVTINSRQRRFLKISEALLEVQNEQNEVDSEVNPIDWAATATRELIIKNQLSGALNIAFSDKWVRYDLVALGKMNLSDAESASLARAQFNEQFPDALDWPLRLTRHGEQLLVAGINPLLLSAAQQISVDCKYRLNSLEPWFVSMWNKHEKTIRQLDGWLLFEEPEVLLVARIKQGNLVHLHSQPFDDNQRESSAQLFLDRQSALLEHPPGLVHIFTYSGNQLKLKAPWHSVQSGEAWPRASNFTLSSPD